MNNLDGIDFAEYLEFVGTQESQSLIKLSDAMDATWERIERGPAIFGETLPWAKTESLVRLRPHEVSLWAGVNGHGKSLVLSQVTAHLCLGSGVAVASLEMTAAAIAERFVRQVSASTQCSPLRADDASAAFTAARPRSGCPSSAQARAK